MPPSALRELNRSSEVPGVRDGDQLREALAALGLTAPGGAASSTHHGLPGVGLNGRRGAGEWDIEEAKDHSSTEELLGGASLAEKAKSLLRGGEEGGLETAQLRLQEAVRADPNAIPPSLLRTLSADSLWFLSEAGARHPEVGQQRRRVFDLLRELASLHRDRSISTQARNLLKVALLEGKLDHVTTVLGLFRRPAGAAAAAVPEPSSPSDGSRADSLMAELIDPISCELLREPVTLHCGHTFSKRSLVALLQTSRYTPNCPTCRTPLSESDKELKVTVIIESGVRRFYGDRSAPACLID
jgi:hypothetical protein